MSGMTNDDFRMTNVEWRNTVDRENGIAVNDSTLKDKFRFYFYDWPVSRKIK